MEEGDDTKEHLDKFFDAVDKLGEMELKVNDDLLAIMLLYSLPSSFENFRCAIESRDELPTPDTLRIKILEESQARKGKNSPNPEGAFFARGSQSSRNFKKGRGQCYKSTHERSKIKCYNCGHKKADCYSKPGTAMMLRETEESAFMGTVNTQEVFGKWCLDSGASSHMVGDQEKMVSVVVPNNSTSLNLATNTTTAIQGTGDVRIIAPDDKNGRAILLNKTLHVPGLRTNLMSVAKMTNTGHKVIFEKQRV